LYADSSKEASDVFLGWIAGRAWLAFVITPTLTVLALFLLAGAAVPPPGA
jgi:hypothetical protein